MSKMQAAEEVDLAIQVGDEKVETRKGISEREVFSIVAKKAPTIVDGLKRSAAQISAVQAEVLERSG